MQVRDVGAPSIRLDPEPEWFRGMKFSLKEIRFTTPSEHTVKSRHFDLEMQMVCSQTIFPLPESRDNFSLPDTYSRDQRSGAKYGGCSIF